MHLDALASQQTAMKLDLNKFETINENLPFLCKSVLPTKN
jgi:dihydroxyacid dehydratase/phosphogluconate dehydratase